MAPQDIILFIGQLKHEIRRDYTEEIIKLKKDDYKKLSELFETLEVMEVKYLTTCIKVKIKKWKNK